MRKRNTQRVHLGGSDGISKTQFDKIKRWAIDLPRGKDNDDLVLLLMDAQQDYLKRVAAHVRAKNPKPKIGKREPLTEVLTDKIEWPSEVYRNKYPLAPGAKSLDDVYNSQIGREDNENTSSDNRDG